MSTNCDLKLNNECKGAEHYGEPCSRLRPLICGVRKQVEAMKAGKKKLIMENPDYPEMGMGAR
jgi:hypothetical protein